MVMLGTAIPRNPYGLAAAMLGGLAVTTAVEYGVIYWMLGRPAKARLRFLFSLLLVNVITNPPVQLATFFIPDLFRPRLLGELLLMLGIVELVVVLVEFGLLRWIFGRMYRGGALNEAITVKRTFLIALTANLASFVVGCTAFIVVMAVIFGLTVFSRGW